MDALRRLRIRGTLSALVILAAGATATATAADTRADGRSCEPWTLCLRAPAVPSAVTPGPAGHRPWTIGDITGDRWCLYARPQGRTDLVGILGGREGNLERWIRNRGARAPGPC
ncbi:hypothetical protein ABZ470_13330 [Streptosporangium sp. NPDC020072]|uniref:hypothetical protein n=1 Tax=unclassified Streptosporangium TaxID=2632669 RepID=UPI0034357C4E